MIFERSELCVMNLILGVLMYVVGRKRKERKGIKILLGSHKTSCLFSKFLVVSYRIVIAAFATLKPSDLVKFLLMGRW